MDEMIKRIISRITVDDNGCWVVSGWRTDDGYGLASNGKTWRTHRAMWIHFNGPFPEGLVSDHLCRNRACCNPDHIEPVTNQYNVKRGCDARAQHCENGHPLSPENRIVTKRGTWDCRICNKHNFNPETTHCKQGHEFTEENTYHRPSGGRECRECRRVGALKYKGR